MTIKTLFAAVGILAASIGVSGAADAQRHRGPDRFEHRDHRSPDRFDRHRGPRGRHYAYGRHDRCRVIYRHHRRVRVCR